MRPNIAYLSSYEKIVIYGGSLERALLVGRLRCFHETASLSCHVVIAGYSVKLACIDE
jgi:hypothetical protein